MRMTRSAGHPLQVQFRKVEAIPTLTGTGCRYLCSCYVYMVCTTVMHSKLLVFSFLRHFFIVFISA